jgi:hypothetical protein
MNSRGSEAWDVVDLRDRTEPPRDLVLGLARPRVRQPLGAVEAPVHLVGHAVQHPRHVTALERLVRLRDDIEGRTHRCPPVDS